MKTRKIRSVFGRMTAWLLSAAMILGMVPCFSLGVAAADESLPSSAIPINSVEELAMIGYEYPSDGYYYLTSDLDLSSAVGEYGDYYNDGRGWEPIGHVGTPFTGTFDGRDYTISGLSINRTESTDTHIGLFGYLSGATVKNLTLNKANVTGYRYVGAIAGYVTDSIISNCRNNSSITAKNSYSGSIVGYMKAGTISYCHNSGSVSSKNSHSGGIVGKIYATGATNIDSSYNSASSITGSNYWSGAIAGYYNQSLAGYLSIFNCYSYASEKRLVAYVDDSTNARRSLAITDCYNIGAGITTRGTVTNCYYSSTAASGLGELRNNRQMRLKSTYTDWDFDTVWTMEGNEDYLYPELISNPSTFKKSLVSISVSSLPDKVNYIEGKETLDITGAELRLTYDNEATEKIPITADMVSGFDNSIVGSNKITVEYEGFTTSFNVTILAKSLVSAEISELPTVLSYLEGRDTLDVTGGKLTLYYNNDTSKIIDITPSMVSGFDKTVTGNQILTVIYGGKSDTYEVEIIPKSMTAIKVTTLLRKVEYLEAKDALDLSGGKLTVYYDNGTSEVLDLSEVVVTGFNNKNVGAQTLTAHYDGFTAEFSVTVTAKAVSRVVVSTLPSTVSYLEGTAAPDATGGKLTVYYNNDTEEIIDMTADMISGFNGSVVGMQTLTVTYGGKSSVYEIEIVAKTLVSIEIVSLPAKLTYIEGKELLNVTGGRIRLYYNNDTDEVIDMTADMISGFDNSTVGKRTLSVTYGGQTQTFEVEIVEKTLVSISVTTKPLKTSYLEGKDGLDVTGGKITLYYNNGTSSVMTMTEDMVSGFDNTAVGTQTLTVLYLGKKASFTVGITEKSLVSVALVSAPKKTEYSEGDKIDLTGGKISAAYDNGAIYELDITDSMISGYDSAKAGKQTVIVTYGDYSVKFDVTVSHIYVATVTPPTCNEQGYTVHLCGCGDSYVDSYVQTTDHTAITDAAVEPTCTEVGLSEGSHCSVCGAVITAQESVPAKGHSYENRQCTECGERDPEVPDHVPGDVNGDGKVDTKDLTRLMKLISGEDVTAFVSDINGDGKVNTKDLTRLMKYLAGEDVEVF